MKEEERRRRRKRVCRRRVRWSSRAFKYVGTSLGWDFAIRGWIECKWAALYCTDDLSRYQAPGWFSLVWENNLCRLSGISPEIKAESVTALYEQIEYDYGKRGNKRSNISFCPSTWIVPLKKSRTTSNKLAAFTQWQLGLAPAEPCNPVLRDKWVQKMNECYFSCKQQHTVWKSLVTAGLSRKGSSPWPTSYLPRQLQVHSHVHRY